MAAVERHEFWKRMEQKPVWQFPVVFAGFNEQLSLGPANATTVRRATNDLVSLIVRRAAVIRIDAAFRLSVRAAAA